jgi:hypothetical protein
MNHIDFISMIYQTPMGQQCLVLSFNLRLRLRLRLKLDLKLKPKLWIQQRQCKEKMNVSKIRDCSH